MNTNALNLAFHMLFYRRMTIRQQIDKSSPRFYSSKSNEYEVNVVQPPYRYAISDSICCKSIHPIKSNGAKNPDSFFSLVDSDGRRFNLMVENKAFVTSKLDLNISYDCACVIIQTMYYAKFIFDDNNIRYLFPTGIIIGDEMLCRSLTVNDVFKSYLSRQDIDWTVTPSEAFRCERNKQALNDIVREIESGKLFLGNAHAVDEFFDIEDVINEIKALVAGMPINPVRATEQNAFCLIQDILIRSFRLKLNEELTFKLLGEILKTGFSTNASVDQDALCKIKHRWSWGDEIANIDLNQFLYDKRTFQLLKEGSRVYFTKNPKIWGVVQYDKTIEYDGAIWGRYANLPICRMMREWIRDSGLNERYYSYLMKCPASGILYNGSVLKDLSESILHRNRIFRSLLINQQTMYNFIDEIIG